MSFGDALRREFVERMTIWARVHRAEVWKSVGGDALRAWAAIRELEGAAISSEDYPNGAGGRLWLIVGDAPVLGVEWRFDVAGKLVELEWTGYDPKGAEKRLGAHHGRRSQQGKSEVQN